MLTLFAESRRWLLMLLSCNTDLTCKISITRISWWWWSCPYSWRDYHSSWWHLILKMLFLLKAGSPDLMIIFDTNFDERDVLKKLLFLSSLSPSFWDAIIIMMKMELSLFSSCILLSFLNVFRLEIWSFNRKRESGYPDFGRSLKNGTMMWILIYHDAGDDEGAASWWSFGEPWNWLEWNSGEPRFGIHSIFAFSACLEGRKAE